MTRRIRRQLLLLAALMPAMASAGAYEDFFRAVDTDNVGQVNELLAQGFDPNTPDERGQRPLYLALRSESYKVAAALLAHPGLKVDATNGADETPLMLAALRGQHPWVERLLARGARVHKEGWSPLHYAASGPETRTVALLLERGAPIDAASPNRTTPLMMAAQYGAETSATLLLDRGAQAALLNDRGHSAADFARRGGRQALAARLETLAR